MPRAVSSSSFGRRTNSTRDLPHRPGSRTSGVYQYSRSGHSRRCENACKRKSVPLVAPKAAPHNEDKTNRDPSMTQSGPRRLHCNTKQSSILLEDLSVSVVRSPASGALLANPASSQRERCRRSASVLSPLRPSSMPAMDRRSEPVFGPAALPMQKHCDFRPTPCRSRKSEQPRPSRKSALTTSRLRAHFVQFP